MPGTRSPTGTYTRVRTPRSRTASCSGSAMPCSTCTSTASSARPSWRAPRTAPTRCCARCGSRTRGARRRRWRRASTRTRSYDASVASLFGPHRRLPALRVAPWIVSTSQYAPLTRRICNGRTSVSADHSMRSPRSSSASTRYACTTQPSCGPFGVARADLAQQPERDVLQLVVLGVEVDRRVRGARGVEDRAEPLECFRDRLRRRSPARAAARARSPSPRC